MGGGVPYSYYSLYYALKPYSNLIVKDPTLCSLKGFMRVLQGFRAVGLWVLGDWGQILYGIWAKGAWVWGFGA